MGVEASRAQFAKALSLHQQGNLPEAERIYTEILRRRPKHAHAMHLLGAIALQTGRPDRAIQLIGKALSLEPNLAAAHRHLGLALTAKARHSEAMASFDRAIALEPISAEAHNDRGNALRALQRPEDALASYRRAIALKTDFAEAYNNLGVALSDLDRLDEALLQYEKAVALRPAYMEAHNNRGNVLRVQGRHAEAKASYLRALQLNPNYRELATGIGVVDDGELRSLHLGSPIAQSTIKLGAPLRLHQPQHRAMLAFLLFVEQPRDILIVGLGGGVLVSFIHRHAPDLRVCAVEIEPAIIAVARSHFGLPPDDDRLRVVAADALDYLGGKVSIADVLILDAYDGFGVSPGLYSRKFFDNCFDALTSTGVLALHLWRSDKNYGSYLQMLGASFGDRVTILPVAGTTHVIAFARRSREGGAVPIDVGERARRLEDQYQIEFRQFAHHLQALR